MRTQTVTIISEPDYQEKIVVEIRDGMVELKEKDFKRLLNIIEDLKSQIRNLKIEKGAMARELLFGEND